MKGNDMAYTLIKKACSATLTALAHTATVPAACAMASCKLRIVLL